MLKIVTKQFLKRKNKIPTAKILSNRSNSPPWPGKMVPESLTPALRLSQDSKRSPMVAKIEIERDSVNVCMIEA